MAVPRRLDPNAVFADMLFYDPQTFPTAGETLGMFIRATSTVDFSSFVENSNAVAYLYLVGQDTPVLNASVSTTALQTNADPEIDFNVADGAVTVQYEWPELSIQEPGAYFYQVYISYVGDYGFESLGVYQSVPIVVSG